MGSQSAPLGTPARLPIGKLCQLVCRIAARLIVQCLSTVGVTIPENMPIKIRIGAPIEGAARSRVWRLLTPVILHHHSVTASARHKVVVDREGDSQEELQEPALRPARHRPTVPTRQRPRPSISPRANALATNPRLRRSCRSLAGTSKSGLLEALHFALESTATGIADGNLLAVFLRGPDDKVIGGAYGWTWGSTCHVRDLFVPEIMRNQGHGTKIMRAIEKEAGARGCEQIVLETHDFQAPEFYRKLGYAVDGVVNNYPRGHQWLTMLKRLPSA